MLAFCANKKEGFGAMGYTKNVMIRNSGEYNVRMIGMQKRIG